MEQAQGLPTTPCPKTGVAGTYDFGSAIDRPVGRIDCVPSGITGRPLRYFTPDPLPELLGRSRLGASVGRAELDPLLGLLLIRAAARNTSSGEVDLPQAKRFLGVLQGATSHPAIDNLVGLAKVVNPKIEGLRKEIIFVGGIVPSSSRHIYAPHTALPALMGTLVEGLTGDEIRRCDALVASVVVGAFCAYTHPFIDGNGRWSRLVAASTAETRVTHWPVMVGVAFQNACKSQLSERVLPEATSGGLRQYLEAALQFEAALTRELTGSAVLKRAGKLTATLKAAARSQSVLYVTLGRLYATGRVPITEVRTSFGLSQRAADGLVQKAVDAAEGMVSANGAFLDSRHLVECLDAGVERAAKTVFG